MVNALIDAARFGFLKTVASRNPPVTTSFHLTGHIAHGVERIDPVNVDQNYACQENGSKAMCFLRLLADEDDHQNEIGEEVLRGDDQAAFRTSTQRLPAINPTKRSVKARSHVGVALSSGLFGMRPEIKRMKKVRQKNRSLRVKKTCGSLRLAYGARNTPA